MTKLPGRPTIPAASTCDEDGSPTLTANDNDPQRIFYVYAWLRPCGTPFYIGKGKGRRFLTSTRRNRVFDSVYAKIKRSGLEPSVVVTHQLLTEAEAFEIEMAEIARYGRIDLKTGVLANLTSGGDGVSGAIRSPEHNAKIGAAHVGMTRSEETRARIAAAAIGRPVSAETRERRRAAMLRPEIRQRLVALSTGKKASKEARAKMSVSQSGRVHSDETKLKISIANRMASPRAGYKGVTFHKGVGAWAATVGRKHIGYYKREVDAAIAYDICAREIWGGDCYLNFPELLVRCAPATMLKPPAHKKPPCAGKMKGATLDKRSGRWGARIRVGGATKHLGMFATQEQAARAYDQAALDEYGAGNCYLNFPEDDTDV